MHLLKTSAATALAISTFVYCAAPGFAENKSGFYISVSPGNYVEYLSLSDSGRQDVTGYLESIRASASSPDGETRSQTFVSVPSNGNVLVFGNRTATRDGDGYTLTYPTSTGEVNEERFARTTVGRVNGAIATLAAAVNHAQTLNTLSVAKAELNQDTHVTSSQAAELAQDQNAIDTARNAQAELQRKADALALVARRLRLDANAAINAPGASFAQNQKSINAMKIADDAAQSARVAQHDADAAGQNAAVATADRNTLRSSIAVLTERARVLSEKLKARGDTIAHP